MTFMKWRFKKQIRNGAGKISMGGDWRFNHLNHLNDFDYPKPVVPGGLKGSKDADEVRRGQARSDWKGRSRVHR